MKKVVVVSMLLVAASMSLGGTLYWNPVVGSDDFMAAANWGNAAFTTASDSLRVGGNTSTYPRSANLAKLTTAFGNASGTGDLNDALLVGGANYTGNFELDNGSNTAYFRSIICGDTPVSGQAPSVMTITSGTIRNGDVSIDTGYMTIGRNNTSGSTLAGVGYLYVNGGMVAMDRITVGELRSGNTVAGEGHIVLQNNGVINLTSEKYFTPPVVGLKVNNGDFTWIDNGSSSVRAGSLSLGANGGNGKLIFQSTDNSFGTDGKGIVVFDNDLGGDGIASFSESALIDVTGLADTLEWVTLVTAQNGFTFIDPTLLTAESVAEGWNYRTVAVDGGTALQVSMIPEPATLGLLSIGALTLLRRKK